MTKYENLPNSNFIVNGVYSRDISVEKAALDVMKNAYQEKKPVSEVNIQTNDVNVVAPNPFSGSVYPTAGTTPVVQNMSQIPVGNQIAPGINEVNSSISEFQPVQGLENPADLMVNTSIENPFLVQEQFNNNPVQYSENSKENNIDVEMQSLIETNASEEQFRQVILEKINAVITNYVDFLGRKTAEELEVKKAQLDKREAELNMMKQEMEMKLSSQYNMQQPQMQQPVFQQAPMQQQVMPGQPMYPTQQNIITENPQGPMNNYPNQMNNGGQMPTQFAPQYGQQEINSFRQVA